MEKTKKGFTLVELIIVIAVIGVLAAILIPTFANVIDKSNKKSALSDSKNALTQCITEFADEGLSPNPDMLFFSHKGSKIYVCGYISEKGELVEYGTSYDYETLEVRAVNAEFDAKVNAIRTSIEDAGHITPATDPNYDRLLAITERYSTENLRICIGLRINSMFAGGNNTNPVTPPEDMPSGEVPGGGNPGGGNPGGENPGGGGSVTDGNIVFAAGENSANGGGVQDGTIPANQTVAVGGFAKIPDNIIPRSVTLTAGNTNAYAFTSWNGSDGKTYYPGDAIKVTTAGTLTLTAQWESGYTVLTEDDDFTKPFDNTAGKYIMGADIAVWYNNSSYMFPIGYDDNYGMWTKTFTGKLDGAGYTLSNLTCSYKGSAVPGGLVYVNDGTVSNMKLKVNGIYTKGVVAGVACTNNGTIRNVDVIYGNRSNYHYSSSDGDIACLNTSTDYKVGGIAGTNSGLISGCSVNGLKINNKSEAAMGGIVAENKSGGTVEKCLVNEMTVISQGSFAKNIAGVVGINGGDVKECTSVGVSITASTYASPVSPLVARHDAGEVKDCFVDWSENTFACSAPANGWYYAGVIVGDCTSASATITNCVGIGNDENTCCAFAISGLLSGSFSESNVTNCYLVTAETVETRSCVTTISASDLTNRSPLTGLTESVWDFSNGKAEIPSCNI